MITLIEQPSSPLEYNAPNVWGVVSDDPAIVQMNMTILLSGAVVPTVTQLPDIGTTAQFTYDINQLVQDFLTYDLQPLGSSADMSATNSFTAIAAIQWAEYVLSGNQLVLGDSLTINPTQIFVNAAWQPQNAKGLPDRVMDISVTGFEKFLTDSPTTLKTRVGESYQLSVYSNSSTINQIRVNVFDSSGTLLSGSNVAYSTSRTGRYDVCVGYDNIVAAGISLTGAAYYTVNLAQGTAQQSERFRFDIDNSCYIDPVRVVWLNRWGGFDAYTFEGQSTNIESTTSFIKEQYRGQGATVSSRGRGYTSRKTLPQKVATTGLLDRETTAWLRSLYSSPQIFVVENGSYVPVTVQDGDYVYNDEARRLTLRITYAWDVATQRQ